MAATLDPIVILERVFTQHGPLHKDEITQHARDRGMDDLAALDGHTPRQAADDPRGAAT